jgi:hypothetical protein
MNISETVRAFCFMEKAASKNWGMALLVLVVLLSPRASAQSRSVSLSGSISLDSLTRYVHRHTGIRFSFNSSKVKGNKQIGFPAGKYSLEKLLVHIKQKTSLYYSMYRGYVIFQDNPPVKKDPPTNPPKKPALKNGTRQPAIAAPKKRIQKTKATVVAATNSDTAKTAASILPKDQMLLPPPVATTDTALRLNASVVVADSTGKGDTLTPAVIRQPVTENVGKPAAAPKKRSPWLTWYSHVGVSVNEIVYTGLTYEGGVQRLHLIFSAGTTNGLFMWRAGLGSVVKQNDRSQWQVNAMLSFIGKNITIATDTAGLPDKEGKIRGMMYSAGFVWCKQFSPKWALRIGPSFNLLHTKYFLSGNAASVSDFPRSFARNEEQLYLVRPPLLLKNTFDAAKPSNSKTWIGGTVGIYYNILRRRR